MNVTLRTRARQLLQTPLTLVCILTGVIFSQYVAGQDIPLKDIEIKIDVDYKEATLLLFLNAMEQATDFSFAYSQTEMVNIKINVKKGNWNMSDLLKELSLQARVSFKRINGTIAVKVAKDGTKLPDVIDIVMTQTIRGKIIDEDGKFPLPGATVVILGTDPLKGTVTDEDGNFKFEKVALGRAELRLTYIGYKDKLVPNVILTSGKEVILNLSMQEAIVELSEVTVRPQKESGEINNEMSLVSAQSITVDETQRFAGSFRDPARMVTAFAGVNSQPEGEGYNNDIVVRGNSPKYVQWRLEGIEIPNPSHFSKLDASGGAISALNSDLLANSDFYMSAFSPEYGDVLSGIFDVKFRNGNNKKKEYSVGVGALGADVTLEGPFKKDYAGSYLVNYRYSTVALLNNLGIIDQAGLPKYQDAAYKFFLPTKRLGTFSFFGLGGISKTIDQNYFIDSRAIADNLYMHANVSARFNAGSSFITSGVNHMYPFSKNTFLETTANYSTSLVFEEEYPTKTGKLYDFSRNFLRDTTSSEVLETDSRMTKTTIRGALKLSSKLSTKSKIEIGTKYTLSGYRYKRINYREAERDWYATIDFDESIINMRNFISWKYRLNENITVVSGIHHFYVFLNNINSIEPRVAARWQLPKGSAISVGFGMHSAMETVSNYYAKIEDDMGNITEPNKNLSLLKATHYVLGYEKRFKQNLRAKVEVYYQDLSDLPVANDSSYYATINEINDFKNIKLVNAGTGKNYGLELTLERFFANHYYFMFTSSLYSSKYTSLEGRERNTRFNGKYAFNLLYGKEFVQVSRKKNKTLALNGRIIYLGAKKYIPLLRDEQSNVAIDWTNYVFYDYKKAYDKGLDNIFQVNFSANYKINNPKATHEISLDIINVTNSAPRIDEYYDTAFKNSVGYDYTLSIIPNIIYRVHF